MAFLKSDRVRWELREKNHDLFDDDPDSPRIARRRDPKTSHDAANDYHAGTRNLDKNTLLQTIRQYPDHTASEYSVILKNKGVDWYKAARMTSKRISDLLADDSIVIGAERVCTKTLKKARTYRAASQ